MTFVKMKNTCFLFALLFFFSLRFGEASQTDKPEAMPAKIYSNESEGLKKPKIAVTYYFDSRDYNTLNIVTSVPKLPSSFKLWGFVDLHGDQNNGSKRFNITRHFLEYRLSRYLFPDANTSIRGLDFEVEYNDFNGPDNDVLRLGLTYKHSVPFFPGSKSWLQWRYHPYETDGTGSQVSAIYFFSLSERIFISGFADLNIEDDKENRWVIEPQINFIVNETFDVALEARYNEFEDANTALDGFGIAVGLKFKF